MRRGTVMAAIGAMTLGMTLLGAAAPGRAQAPPGTASSGRPDVVVLVYQQPGSADLVDITYAHTVPHAQAQRDLAALAQAGGWVVGPSRITDGAPPVRAKLGAMTSSKFTAPGVVQNETHTLPVVPFITAFRAYKRLVLIFSVGPGFQFQGARDFANNDVQVAQEQHGTAYTYQVRILNPQFSRLDLPRPAVPPRRAAPWLLFLGVLAAAGAAGSLVYVLMARKPGPPAPPANTDSLSPEQARLGTGG